jgi:hypothetical protein
MLFDTLELLLYRRMVLTLSPIHGLYSDRCKQPLTTLLCNTLGIAVLERREDSKSIDRVATDAEAAADPSLDFYFFSPPPSFTVSQLYYETNSNTPAVSSCQTSAIPFASVLVRFLLFVHWLFWCCSKSNLACARGHGEGCCSARFSGGWEGENDLFHLKFVEYF